MGKEEKMLSELLEKVSSLEDKLTNMEFLMVQGMGTGGTTPKIPSGASPSAPMAGSVEVDLTPLENRISEIDRKVIDLLSWQLGPNLTARSNANQRAMMLRDYATPDKGHHIYYLSTEDEAKARVKYKPIWDKWVNDVSAKGYDGRKILDEGIWLVEKYKNA